MNAKKPVAFGTLYRTPTPTQAPDAPGALPLPDDYFSHALSALFTVLFKLQAHNLRRQALDFMSGVYFGFPTL